MTCKQLVDTTDWVPYGDINVRMPGSECEYEGGEEELVTEYGACDEACPGYEELPGKYDMDERV